MDDQIEPQAPATAKGRATRDRVVAVAADLVYANGVQGTSNDDVRRAAGISGSQLTHYFPDKRSLVRAIVASRAEQAVALSSMPPSGALDSIDALRRWADFYLASEDRYRGGCRLGSLAGEILKSGLDARADVADGFGRWEGTIRDGIAAMRRRGELRDDADPDRLATLVLAAFEGGMLLAQAKGDAAPLRAALDGAIDHVASFAVPAA
jgi:AcrR family transcriptional regulator